MEIRRTRWATRQRSAAERKVIRRSNVPVTAGLFVTADPGESASPEHLEQIAKAWSIQADAFDAATEQINAGKFKTILEVNVFIDAEVKSAAPPK